MTPTEKPYDPDNDEDKVQITSSQGVAMQTLSGWETLISIQTHEP